ncbi:MAG: choice-of-anchor D domain-containing protein [Planctomycetota bacterium]
MEEVNADGTTTTRTDANQSDVRTIDNNGGNGSIVIRAETGEITLDDGSNFEGSTVSAQGAGNILVQAIEDSTNLNANVESESGHITILASADVTSGATSDVATGGEGSIEIQAKTGSIILDETSDQETDSGDIRFQAGTNVLLGGTVITTGNIRVTAESGWIHDRNDDSGLDLMSSGLCLAAGREIGTRDTSADNPLETSVDTVSLRSGDDVNLLETDEFVFDNVWVTVDRVGPDGMTVPVTDMFWIMDDGDSQHEAVGNWGRGGLSGAYEAMRFNITDVASGPYEKNYQYQVKKSRDYHYNAPGSGSDTSVWTFTELVPGEYEAFTTWTPHENRATNVPFTLSGGTQQNTVRVNQEVLPKSDKMSQGVRFQRLGSILVDSEGTLTVAVSDDANDYVIADAVWIRCKSQTTEAPTVDSLIASPDPVTQPDVLTLTAENVQDNDGTVRKVEFYRDSNNNGILDVDADELLGTDQNSSGGWTYTGESSGFPTDTNRCFARARDDYGAWSEVVSTTVTVNPRPVPEITVLGNGVSITDGKATPDSEDHTDFGTGVVAESGPTRTYTVRNDGTARLTLEQVNVPGGYTVEETLSNDLDPGESDTFTVRLETSSSGLKTGQISFSNNDSDEDPFDFAITGTVEPQPEPEITVVGNDITILDGDETPSTEDDTDFGTAPMGQPGPTRTFTVRNDGTADLTLGQVDVPTDYILTEALSGNLAAGASDTFTVRLDTSSPGVKAGQISFSNNDGNENPFSFAVTGEVNERPTIGSLSDGPDPVTQPDEVTLTAHTVDDADGSVLEVEFYRDTNDNGALDVETDDLLGTDESSDEGWTYSVETSSFNAGTNQYFARARDDSGAWSEVVGTTGTVEVPPEPEITVLGNGVSIADGATVPATEDHTDFGTVLVGQAAPTRTYTVRNDGPATLVLGSVTVPRGYSVTDALSDTLAADASDTFTVRMDTLSAGTKTGEIRFSNNDSDESPFTFAVEGKVGDVSRIIDDGDTGHSMIGDWGQGGLQGAYDGKYRYRAPGSGAQKSIWTFSNLTPGEYEVFTTWTPHGNRATNAPYTISSGTGQKTIRVNQEAAPENNKQSQGVPFQRLGSIVVDAEGTLTVTLSNDANEYVVADAAWVKWQAPPTQAPTVGSLNASPDPVTQPNSLTLTATDVEDTDGSVRRVEFYRDADGDGILDVGMDELLGADTVSDGWTYSGETASFPTGVNRYFARAQDDYGVWSEAVSTTGTVEAQPVPEITVLGNDVSITDGKATPTLEDHTDFGEGVLEQAGPTRTFTVRNDGTTTLTLGSISVPAGYTVTEALPTSLAAGASDAFTVRLDTLSTGTKTGQITFSNNDAEENPFNFTIIGTVNEPVETTPPNPAVSTWHTEPYATGSTSVRMIATTADDPSGVEYYFEETTGNAGGSDSGWQDSPIYVDTGLTPETAYTYRVKTRDKSLNQNEGTYSISRSATTPENSKPNTPNCSSPADDSSDVHPTPTLESSEFSDPDSGDSHQATRWQVAIDDSFNNMVWDYTDTDSEKTREAVPAGKLLNDVKYYWRVRHQDNHGSWSSWSNPREFTTADVKSVIDDGNSSHAFEGGWGKGGLSGSYNGDYWYAEAGSGSKKSTWTFTGLAAGQYEVLASWTAHENRANNAPFTLDGGSEAKTVRVDQEHPCNDEQGPKSGVWFDHLANITVDAQGKLTVTLTNNANDYVIADSVWVKYSAPLLTAGGPRVAVENATPLTEAELRPITAEGLSRWARAGLPDELLNKLNRTDFGVVDLPGAHLGMATSDGILIDSDAAGHGWFIDPTPDKDNEFSRVQESGDLRAVAPNAVDRIDLLTVVSHELGHIAGLDDLASSTDDLMSATLETGRRRVPGESERDAVFASENLWKAVSN